MSNFPNTDFLLLQLKLKGIWQRRSLGQHFLTSEDVLTRIGEGAQCGPQTLALEIGPGPGTLTAQLARHAGGVLAVEFDTRLKELHADAFGTYPQIKMIYHDALRVDLAAEAKRAMQEQGLTEAVLTGNLPFQITSPLLFAQTGPDILWRRMAVMVQKEVADRITARPHTKDYGILTVKLAYWWRVAERFEVPASMFFPRPKVDAAVLFFDRVPQDDTPSGEEWTGLSGFVDAAFGQRRKMLVNSLAGRWKYFQNKEEILAALVELGINIQTRAEDLSIEEIRKLHQLLRP